MNDLIFWSPGVTLEDIEKEVIVRAFSHYRNNKTATANSLGISIRTLETRLEKYAEETKKEEQRFIDDKIKRDEILARSRGVQPSIDPVIFDDEDKDDVVSETFESGFQTTTLKSKQRRG